MSQATQMFLEPVENTGNGRKQADGYLNTVGKLTDKNGVEHTFSTPNFPLFRSNRIHKAILDNADVIIEGGKITFEITSVKDNAIQQDDIEV